MVERNSPAAQLLASSPPILTALRLGRSSNAESRCAALTGLVLPGGCGCPSRLSDWRADWRGRWKGVGVATTTAGDRGEGLTGFRGSGLVPLVGHGNALQRRVDVDDG